MYIDSHVATLLEADRQSYLSTLLRSRHVTTIFPIGGIFQLSIQWTVIKPNISDVQYTFFDIFGPQERGGCHPAPPPPRLRTCFLQGEATQDG